MLSNHGTSAPAQEIMTLSLQLLGSLSSLLQLLHRHVPHTNRSVLSMLRLSPPICYSFPLHRVCSATSSGSRFLTHRCPILSMNLLYSPLHLYPSHVHLEAVILWQEQECGSKSCRSDSDAQIFFSIDYPWSDVLHNPFHSLHSRATVPNFEGGPSKTSEYVSLIPPPLICSWSKPSPCIQISLLRFICQEENLPFPSQI